MLNSRHGEIGLGQLLIILYVFIFALTKMIGGQQVRESLYDGDYDFLSKIEKTGEELPRDLETIPVDKNGFMTDVSISENDPQVSNYTYWGPGVDGKHRPGSAYFVGFVPFETDKVWVPIVAVSTRLKYKGDTRGFSLNADVWQTSRYSYRRKAGDCEDHAILLADWLIQMGHDARVVVGSNYFDAHAWVVVFENGRVYTIEATKKGVKPTVGFPNEQIYYSPTHMFNHDTSWKKGVGGLKNWKKVARFI